MTVLGSIDINARQGTGGSREGARQRCNKQNSSLHEFEIDHDEDDTEGSTRKTANATTDAEDEHGESQPLTAAGRLQNARNRRSLASGTLPEGDDDSSHQKGSAKAAKLKRRRRSSARFLRLPNVTEDDNDGRVNNSAELGQMYNQVIRMHAENKINSNNSWGLKLIENLDKLLADDSIGSSETGPTQRSSSSADSSKKGFNFTKASCTLDASTKIYSYRVDDVHLTSYRVLANLNRSDNAGKKGAVENATKLQSTKKQSDRRGVTETLESNIANVNMNKQESAFDIDPLFHKMSKKFDEGGAKGLLLANLGVATSSCGIVFDSKEDSTPLLARAAEHRKSTTETFSKNDRVASSIDLSSLASKLHSLLDGDSIQDVPLVPQLALLREDHSKLDAEGFVNKLMPTQKSRRYAPPVEEEHEAEKSIHLEALERSRMSQTNVTFAGNESESFGTNDFDYGDDDDDNDDAGFNDFLELDECAAKYASSSFLNDTSRMSETSYSEGQQVVSQPASVAAAVTFLDMISNGDSLIGGNKYGYFDSAALQKMTAGNIWAGASHWKKCPTKKKTTVVNESGGNQKTKPDRSKKSIKKTFQLIDFTTTPSNEIYTPPKRTKRSKAEPLQLSVAIKRKNARSEHCLPRDSGVGSEQLTRLFCRPKAQLHIKESYEDHPTRQRKTVGFADTMNGDMLFTDGGHDDSCDDGPGFQFNAGDDDDDSHASGFLGSDDYVVKELTGIRKVSKVRVGFATVAKKVDVKRLKKDLWQELESRIGISNADLPTKEESCTDEVAAQSGRQSLAIAPNCPPEGAAASSGNDLSFQRIVSHLDAQQSQVDVTLPFYFICVLHLANEKGLKLEAQGSALNDFIVRKDDGTIVEAREIFSNDREPSCKRTQRGIASVNYEGLDCNDGVDG